MKILHINASDISGGAARAAYRIHRSLVEHGAPHGLQSQMRVISRQSDDPSVINGAPRTNPISRRLQPYRSRRARQGFNPGYPAIISLAAPAPGLGRDLKASYYQGDAELIHLHWLGDDTLSIEEIGQLLMPVVWTLHDQWAFCGGEHYTNINNTGLPPGIDERFVLGYNPDNRPGTETGPDLNRKTWDRKRRSWRKPIQIVCPSTWLAECASKSALMGRWPISVIPYPIDLSVWAPLDQQQARAVLQLPQDCPLILFGSDGAASDPRKGFDLLEQALKFLHPQLQGTSLQRLQLLIFGQGRPAQPPDLGFPIHYSGRLHDQGRLKVSHKADCGALRGLLFLDGLLLSLVQARVAF